MANHNKRNKKLQQGEGSGPFVGGNPPQPSARSRGIARRQFLTSALASLAVMRMEPQTCVRPIWLLRHQANHPR